MKNNLLNIVQLNIVQFIVGAAIFCATGTSNAQEYQYNAKSNMNITKAVLVVEEFMKSPDREAVAFLMRNAAAVAVFPSVYKGAFFLGAEYGTGVMCSLDKRSGQWSAPAFFTLGGGSIGYQFGAQATDLILVIMNNRGLQSLLKDNVTLGGDVSVAAGPLGRKAQAETDAMLKAEIYSYSRSKGAFAGIALKGAVIAPDIRANRSYYKEVWKPEDILLHRKVKPQGSALELIGALKKFIE